MKIAVLGAGAWGSALASALSAHAHHVTLWGRETQVIAELRATRINTRFLPEIELDQSLRYSDHLQDTLDAHNAPDDVLIIATPISGLRETAQKIATHPTQAAVLWLCKGV